MGNCVISRSPSRSGFDLSSLEDETAEKVVRVGGIPRGHGAPRGHWAYHKESESSFHEVAQQFRQDILRNFEQEVDVLGEPGTAAKHERESADERVTDRSGVERLRQRLDGPYGIARQ